MASRKTSTGRSLPRQSSRGFTLIEIVVVMGLLAVVGGVTLIVSMDSFRGYTFRSEVSTLTAVLQKARSQAVNNMCFGAGCTNGKPHGIHIEGNTYTIFQGASYAARDQAQDEMITPQSKAVTLSGITDVVFTELSGAAATLPSGAPAIILSDNAGKTSSVSINAEGRICADAASC
ncbi:MAG TPA: prepilin-type N-terminal cleavage/methylation domain-containing protein [Candidatus Paceibacterota bacterium]|nr:prepilin-type N-terminal cleavage/methylation domain-containing protein [Candidatus Paceibacterota bacterium]